MPLAAKFRKIFQGFSLGMNCSAVDRLYLTECDKPTILIVENQRFYQSRKLLGQASIFLRQFSL
jgi:hypothetical protein